MRIESWGRFSVDVHRVRNSRPSPFSLSYPGQEGALVADFFLKRLSLSLSARENRSADSPHCCCYYFLCCMQRRTWPPILYTPSCIHVPFLFTGFLRPPPPPPPLPLLALSKPPSRGTRTQNDVHIRIPRVFLQDGTPAEKKREVAL